MRTDRTAGRMFGGGKRAIAVACSCLLLLGWVVGAEETPNPLPDWIRHPDRALSITATEISVDQFIACADAAGCESIHFRSCNIAKEQRGDHPMNCVDYVGAEQYCAWAGGRLCSEDEWLSACRGTDSRAFPYGESYDIDACNLQSLDNPVPGRPRDTTPVATHERCVGGLDGLYDMAGNVAEWVDACKGDYCKFRGGAFLTNDPVDHFAGCGGICAGNQKSFTSGSVGIRCCRDEQP